MTTRNVRLGFRPLCNKILLLYFGVIFLIEIRLKYEFNSAFIVFLGIQYVVPALLAYTSRKATAKAIGIGVTNHHRSWFKSTFWVILVNFWAIGCIVLVTWNHIQSAINKGQLWKNRKNPIQIQLLGHWMHYFGYLEPHTIGNQQRPIMKKKKKSTLARNDFLCQLFLGLR